MASANKDNNAKPTTVVHCWSAPRSRSTALLYSFEARGSDTVAIDEPRYRRWLIEKGDQISRPYRENIVTGIPPDGDEEEEGWRWKRELGSLTQRIEDAVTKIREGSDGGGEGVVFLKDMAKYAYLYDFDSETETTTSGDDAATSKSTASIPGVRHRHLLLLRDPVSVLSSWDNSSSVHGNNPTPEEIGIVSLLQIYSSITSRRRASSSEEDEGESSPPVVILDSDQLVSDPVGTLQTLCSDLDIEYRESMLRWQPGPHECDGPWAKWWYGDVHKSDGWKIHPKRTGADYPATYPTTSKYRTLDRSLMETLRLSLSAYEFLKTLTPRWQQRALKGKEEMYEDERNEDLLCWIGPPGKGRLVPREMAGVSPWDSSVQGGDAAWEGLRVYRGKILSLEKHLRRLFKSAKALGFENVHTKEEVVEAIFRTLAVNGMRDGAHMRLTLTRGEKCTSSMNPKFNVYGTTLIILAEWKPTEGATTYDNTKGISLISASQRRNPPSTVDSKIHHNNMINNILPKIQANLANAADAIMLDLDGFVSETNATNIFMVDNGVLLTPHADHCLPGITRETVLHLAKELEIPVEVRRVSLAEFHSADEVFTTGTMGELTPVTMIDGRVIGSGRRGPVTERLQEVYRTLPERDGWSTEIPPFA